MSAVAVNASANTNAVAPTPAPVAAAATVPKPKADLAASDTLDADVKSVRAYERARQKALKPADIKKAKAQRQGRPRHNGWGCLCCEPWKWRGTSGRQQSDEWKDRKVVTGADDALEGYDLTEKKSYDLSPSPERPSERRVVSLMEILKPSKPKGIAKDFEVIPQMRHVIALDDDDDESSSGDDWEDISADIHTKPKATVERKRSARPSNKSYADVTRAKRA